LNEFDEIADLQDPGRETGPSDTTPSEVSDDGTAVGSGGRSRAVSGGNPPAGPIVTADAGLGAKVPASSRPGKQKKSKKRQSSTCPRWMHHRKGVFCKACETTP
jgi:hypothetical protein